MNGYQSFAKSSNNLSLLVPIHTKSHQLPFNSCSNIDVLQNLSLTPMKLLATSGINLPVHITLSLSGPNGFCHISDISMA